MSSEPHDIATEVLDCSLHPESNNTETITIQDMDNFSGPFNEKLNEIESSLARGSFDGPDNGPEARIDQAQRNVDLGAELVFGDQKHRNGDRPLQRMIFDQAHRDRRTEPALSGNLQVFNQHAPEPTNRLQHQFEQGHQTLPSRHRSQHIGEPSGLRPHHSLQPQGRYLEQKRRSSEFRTHISRPDSGHQVNRASESHHPKHEEHRFAKSYSARIHHSPNPQIRDTGRPSERLSRVGSGTIFVSGHHVIPAPKSAEIRIDHLRGCPKSDRACSSVSRVVACYNARPKPHQRCASILALLGFRADT